MIRSEGCCPYYSRSSLGIVTPLAIVYSLVMNVFRQLTILHTSSLSSSRLEAAACFKEPIPWPQRERNSVAPSHERIAVVTGSNTGIGFETAQALALRYGYTVVLACRSSDKAQQAVQRINQKATDYITMKQSNGKIGKAVFIHPLDLTSFRSISAFIGVLKETLGPETIHVLVNNAGRNTNTAEPTEDGLDLLFQSNFLGHYLLTRKLIEHNLLVPKVARVVNLSSVMHHYCRGYDLTCSRVWHEACQPQGGSGIQANKYSLSKLAALLFSIELNRRYSDRLLAITVNPGAVYVSTLALT